MKLTQTQKLHRIKLGLGAVDLVASHLGVLQAPSH